MNPIVRFLKNLKKPKSVMRIFVKNTKKEQLTNSERIALLRILINYTVPKLQTERSQTTEHKEFTVKVL